MTTINCRHCDAQYPNPLRLRVHTREAHPEKRHQVDAGRLITPVRGPRPGGSLKRPETDTWPARP